MTQKTHSTTQTVHSSSLSIRMLQGAGIALMLISAFLLSAGKANPEWPKFWIIKPLLMVPFAGAMGGAFYYLLDPMRHKGGWRKVLAAILSLIVYVIGLWLGTVLGLNGTMWN